jgi:sulfide dehydrogenase cytochrome subunit
MRTATILALTMLAMPAAAQERGLLLAGACQGCHGVSGGGSHGIAATHRRAEFAAIMRDFRENRREATVMGRIARGYSDEDIAALAAQYAARD